MAWNIKDRLSEASDKLMDTLHNAGVKNTDEVFEALNDYVDAKLELLADDLRDRMDGHGKYDRNW